MSFAPGEGGTCAYCGATILSYQRQPAQTTRNGKKYCSPHCASEDQRPRLLPDGGEAQDYWLATGHQKHTRKVHTDRDCTYLQQAENIRPAADVEVDRFDLCPRCADAEPVNDEQDWEAYRTLSDADAELITDGGTDREPGDDCRWCGADLTGRSLAQHLATCPEAPLDGPDTVASVTADIREAIGSEATARELLAWEVGHVYERITGANPHAEKQRLRVKLLAALPETERPGDRVLSRRFHKEELVAIRDALEQAVETERQRAVATDGGERR